MLVSEERKRWGREKRERERALKVFRVAIL